MIKIKNIILPILITLVLLVIVEGLSTWIVAIKSVDPLSDELKHTAYDSRLGWTNVPDTYFPNIYGEGKYVRINQQGFRNDSATSKKVAEGITRIICSGDSFTFGQGVANDKTWCDLIASYPSIESVNMAIPGYGADQAYLRYMSEAAEYEHHIHIFAFIGADLERMTRSSQHDFGKPILQLDKGELILENVPVPKLSMTLLRKGRLIGSELNTIKIANYILHKFIPTKKQNKKQSVEKKVNRLSPILSKVFQKIKQAKMTGDTTIFVYLPTEGDLRRNNLWRKTASELAEKLDLDYLDLTMPMRNVSAFEANGFFIPKYYPGASHYTELGNRWVADQISEYIRKPQM